MVELAWSAKPTKDVTNFAVNGGFVQLSRLSWGSAKCAAIRGRPPVRRTNEFAMQDSVSGPSWPTRGSVQESPTVFSIAVFRNWTLAAHAPMLVGIASQLQGGQMKRTFVTAIFLIFASALSARAEFLGELDFQPAGCKGTGQCELIYDFGYIDPKGVGWQAKAGLKTDGASIPSWAQLIVGGAWDGEFIRAAIIHDHYCERTVRPRTATHRMFYDALIESGVAQAKALVMYYAVMVGSHMWINLMEGQPCSGMGNCVRSRPSQTVIPGASVRSNQIGELQAYRPPRFDDPAVMQDIREAQKIIEAGSVKAPEEVEQLAKRRNPSDFFLTHGDSVRFQGPSSRLRDR